MANFTDRKDIRSAIQNISWWRKQIENGRDDYASLEKFAMWWNYIEAEREALGLKPHWRKIKLPAPKVQVTRTYYTSSVEARPPTDWQPGELQWL